LEREHETQHLVQDLWKTISFNLTWLVDLEERIIFEVFGKFLKKN